ncbi:MAG: alpha-L-arabinofuranosidase C-terminal domain-containing protein [Cyclobacteriaceae bacterium]
MIQRITLFFIALTSSLSLIAQEKATITIHADQGETIIDKDIYGHFAEHLGRCIYGGFYVGDTADIPNTNGVRNDVIEALNELKVPVLRWPGGCFADTYHWMDGVGPKDERPTIVNTWWGDVTEDNSFGTHDFLNMCEMLNAEPYLSGNVGSGEVQELSDWVQYTNHDGTSPMADLRRENGREEPWGVKFWGIGNEAWGCGGNMRAEYYADVYRKYATFVSDWENTGGIYRIASGASDNDYHWTEVLMRDVPHNLIEGVALHHYSVIDWSNKGPDVDFAEEHYFKIMQQALLMEELVTKHSEIMDKYDPDNEIALIVDEWGGWYNVQEGTNPGFLYQQNTMRDAMIAGATLNIFHNHARRVKMANLAQAINVLQAVILTDEEKMLLTPTYHVMKMYNVHQDATLLPIDLSNVTYEHNGEQLPAISASASQDSTGAIHISLVNIHASEAQEVDISLLGTEIAEVSGTILTSGNLQDHNSFESPEAIVTEEFDDFRKRKEQMTVNIPPFSVVVLEVK